MKRKSKLDTWAKKNPKKEDADIDAQMIRCVAIFKQQSCTN